MPRVIFLVGLAGSGKSRKATRMEKDEGLVWVDSVEHQLKDGTKPNYQKLLNNLRAGQNCIAEERETVRPAFRASIEARLKREVPHLEVEFWFYEKDIVKATRNVLSRPNEEKNQEQHLLMNCFDYVRYVIPTDPGTVIFPIEEPTKYPKRKKG